MPSSTSHPRDPAITPTSPQYRDPSTMVVEVKVAASLSRQGGATTAEDDQLGMIGMADVHRADTVVVACQAIQQRQFLAGGF